MNFQKLEWLPYIIPVLAMFLWLTLKFEKKYFTWIKKYFFYERSFVNKLSKLFYVLAFIFFFIAILDLRGPEQQHKSQIPDQKTIVIIDSSASMSAEDIRPNRFQKSILLARHFIKKAVGHQIAVVLFSDTQKRLVPFTDDIDLLDSRVAGLARNELLKGGSNITQAIKESFQYFKVDAGKESSIGGNVLVFTDSEEHENTFSLEIPDKVNLAVVGVGTARGAPIPIRNAKGTFYGYKKFKGENVVTKLDEAFIKKLGSDASNFKYWISTSFSIPTEEILSFFRNIHKSKLNEGLVRTRPVYAQYIVYPAVILLIIANLLGGFKTFTVPLAAFLLFLVNVNDVRANEDEEEKPLSEKTVILMSKMKKGGIGQVNKLKLGELLATDERNEHSLEIYKENLKKNDYLDQPLATANFGTIYLKTGNINDAAKIYADLNEIAELPEDFKNTLRKNILLAFQQKKNQKQKKDKKNKDKKKKSGQEGDDKNQKSSDGSKGEEKDKKNKDKKDGKKKKDKDKEKDKNKDKKDGKKKKDKMKQQSLEEREEELRKKRKMVKIPAMLKQIMDTDRQLQKRYQDTSTRDRTRNRQRKDW
ncbi:MAG: VWA domain-containing protein [Bacteriovoracaceae bacterium]|nr:VWA domain-containing protein [Bacteriovoracaceae bacterium]